jgi:hypothetical protein
MANLTAFPNLSSKPGMLIIAVSLVPLPLPPLPSIAGSWAELPLSLPPITAPVITPRNEHSMICNRVPMMISMGHPDQGGPTQDSRTAAKAGGRESKASCWAGFNARAIISQGKVHQSAVWEGVLERADEGTIQSKVYDAPGVWHVPLGLDPMMRQRARCIEAGDTALEDRHRCVPAISQGIGRRADVLLGVASFGRTRYFGFIRPFELKTAVTCCRDRAPGPRRPENRSVADPSKVAAQDWQPVQPASAPRQQSLFPQLSS